MLIVLLPRCCVIVVPLTSSWLPHIAVYSTEYISALLCTVAGTGGAVQVKVTERFSKVLYVNADTGCGLTVSTMVVKARWPDFILRYTTPYDLN